MVIDSRMSRQARRRASLFVGAVVVCSLVSLTPIASAQPPRNHEGRSVIYVARQLGHPAEVLMRTYGHVIEELDEAPRITAEDAIMAARSEQMFGRAE
jgi:hypothetical protein